MQSLTLAIVVPCFNEQDVIDDTALRLMGLLRCLKERVGVSDESFVLFIDDGSVDKTWSKLLRINRDSEGQVRCLKLSGNFGHQNAVFAGLELVTGKVDCAVTIDADLQDDLSVLIAMLEQYRQGNEIVFGVRNLRDKDGLFKRLTAEVYYRLIEMMGIKVVFNHADYRLMGKKSLLALSRYGEFHLFLRGIVASMGFKTSCVYYARTERQAGETKYNLAKMLALAWDGITSFSVLPLRALSVLGVFIFLVSVTLGFWTIISYFYAGDTVPGWASTTLPIYALGGIQLLALGVVGEYLGKVYMEVKRRPRYLVDEVLGFDGSVTAESQGDNGRSQAHVS